MPPLLTRRQLLKLGASLPLVTVSPWPARAKSTARIVVIGGGFGGATCAKYLRRADAALQVTLVTPDRRFVTCPFSNTVLAHRQELASLTHTYERLQTRYGIQVMYTSATGFDPVKRIVTLSDGKPLSYDHLVLSPGIELQWNALEGYDAAASAVFPHAWEAGEQTLLLRRQLEAMPDGGLVVITAPDNPFRCPPGPYERASLIAHYLKTYKPRSKVLLLDAKDTFTKQDLFLAAWKRLYPGILEWVSGSRGGRVVRVDPQAGMVHTEFDDYKPAVANVIPPQRAAAIARVANLDEGRGWCTIRASTFSSERYSDIHVIGDAAIANPMPKSAFGASNQAKVCAAAIVARVRGEPTPAPVLMNTCYSLVAPDYGISIVAVYQVENDTIETITGSAGVSPLDAPDEIRALEAEYARSWYANITADAFS
ncbi:MAG: FCSD flavin-binding domain-containing protein [Candidatus Binatia bacterium]